MKVIFGNGKEVVYLNALETEEYWGGSNRRTLTFTCEPSAIDVDTLNTILSNEKNTETLKLVGSIVEMDGTEQEVTNIYENYTMKLKVGIDKEVAQPGGPNEPTVYEDKLIFKLGQPTYIEQQLHKLGIQ